MTGGVIPHALSGKEIKQFIDETVKAALKAVEVAGADGVEM